MKEGLGVRVWKLLLAAVLGLSFTLTLRVGQGLADGGQAAPPAAPPSIVTVTPGYGQVTVDFSPPDTSAGSSITGYRLTATSADGTPMTAVDGPASPLTVSGLHHDQLYTLILVAHTDQGDSPGTNYRYVLPVLPPSAPTITEVVPGDGLATIYFEPPAADGGRSIIMYQVLASGSGNQWNTGNGSPIVVSGLQNGTSYTFTVVAYNCNYEPGLSSAPSAPVTPDQAAAGQPPAPTSPEAPTITQISPGLAQATVAFSAPLSSPGPITGYRLTVTNAGGDQVASVEGPDSPLTASGLSNDRLYTFSLVAISAQGDSPETSYRYVLPIVPPGAPTVTEVIPGDGQATIHFTPPVANGGRPLIMYQVVASPGGQWNTGNGSPITVSGLRNGTSYTFTVAAYNCNYQLGAASDPSPPAIPFRSYNVTVEEGIRVWSMAAGAAHTVALKTDGVPVAWGNDTFGQSTVPPEAASEVYAVAAGWKHTLALKNDGTVVAWGDDSFGQGAVPTDLAGVAAVAAGGYHSVALKEDGTVVGWGDDSFGQATAPDGLDDVIAVAAGGDHTVAVRDDGTVVAWGRDDYGQTDVPAGLGGVIAVAAGWEHTVALKTDGTVVAWGSYDGGLTWASVPAKAATGVQAIGAGRGFTLALKSDGTVVAWGPGSPGVPAGLTGVQAIAAGGAHAVALKGNGTVVAWGNNTVGQTVVPVDLNQGIAHGEVTCTSPVVEGENSACLISPNPGYNLTSFLVNGVESLARVRDNSYTIANLRSDQVVSASFGKPLAVPGAPVLVEALPDNNGKVVVRFSPPFASGGSPITGYTVTASPGGRAVRGSASPLTVAGLGAGTYTFTVAATNKLGLGAASLASNSVTLGDSNAPPPTVPGPPLHVAAKAEVGRATVIFSAPLSNGGAPISKYTVTSNPGGKIASGPGSPLTVGGLANGTTYTFTVTATNRAGTGLASAVSDSVSTPALPDPPTEVVAAVAGIGTARISFSPPATDGDLPITGYTVLAKPGDKMVSGKASPLTVGGLANGTTYTFTVTATNRAGTGAASAVSNSLNTPSVPGAPTNVVAVAGIGTASVSFSAPLADGALPITGYTVVSRPGGKIVSGKKSPLTVSGLTNGKTYTFTVTATNKLGRGTTSAASNRVTPLGKLNAAAKR